jgi:hypothetical protein
MDDGVDDLDDERKDDDHDKEPNGRHRADNDGHNAGDLIIGGSGISTLHILKTEQRQRYGQG